MIVNILWVSISLSKIVLKGGWTLIKNYSRKEISVSQLFRKLVVKMTSTETEKPKIPQKVFNFQESRFWQKQNRNKGMWCYEIYFLWSSHCFSFCTDRRASSPTLPAFSSLLMDYNRIFDQVDFLSWFFAWLEPTLTKFYIKIYASEKWIK